MDSHSTPDEKKIIQFNESAIKDHLGEMVRSTVEETLNQMLDAEADHLCNAEKYQRSEARKDTRAGHYQRKLHTRAGEVDLKVPKLRRQTFETAIIERYRRRETSVEEALVEMYLAGVSVRRVEDITEALWGTKVSPGTISNLNKKVYKTIEAWRRRPINETFPYVYLDGVVLKRSWGGEVSNVSVLVAIGVNDKGYRKILGVVEGAKEDKSGWSGFLRHLKKRGLKGVRLFISDACMGLIESLADFYPDAQWQRCTVHFYRNVFSVVPRKRMALVAAMLKAIHASEDLEAAREKAQSVWGKLQDMKLPKAAEKVKESIEQTLTYYRFPQKHWRRIRTNNGLERIMKEIRRRTRVVGAFPDGNAALMLCAARLRYVAGSRWGRKRYLDMDLLKDQELEKQLEAATA
ncbi:MAG: IS256 family transposase [Deltaproteobacteria bacterium]